MRKIVSALITSVLVLGTVFSFVGCNNQVASNDVEKVVLGELGDEIKDLSYETETNVRIVFQYLEEGGYEISEDEKYMINEESSLSPVIGKSIIVHPYIGELNPETQGDTLNDYRAKLIENGADESLLPETMIFGRYGFYDKQSEDEYVLYLEYYDTGKKQYASFTFSTIDDDDVLAEVFETKEVGIFTSGILLMADVD